MTGPPLGAHEGGHADVGLSTRAAFRRSGDVELTPGARAVLLVSVGQRYHEGDKLRATIELINRSGFAYCTIAVCDTLQRHNVVQASAHSVTRALGDQWLSRNDEAIRRLTIEHQILRWDDVLSQAEYPVSRELIVRAYETYPLYRGAVNETIERFVDRLSKRERRVDRADIFARCLAYLLEECPFMPMWASQGYDYVVYPQPMTPAMHMTRQVFVAHAHRDKVNWLWLRFKKRRVAATV